MGFCTAIFHRIPLQQTLFAITSDQILFFTFPAGLEHASRQGDVEQQITVTGSIASGLSDDVAVVQPGSPVRNAVQEGAYVNQGMED